LNFTGPVLANQWKVEHIPWGRDSDQRAHPG